MRVSVRVGVFVCFGGRVRVCGSECVLWGEGKGFHCLSDYPNLCVWAGGEGSVYRQDGDIVNTNMGKRTGTVVITKNRSKEVRYTMKLGLMRFRSAKGKCE